MDFSRSGVTEPVGGAFRVHVQWKKEGVKQNIYGSRRTDEQTAEKDLETMRSAASGKSREEGFAAMDAEANRLKKGKAAKEEGAVEPTGMGFRAHIQWREDGPKSNAYGPRRYEKRRAQEDLEAMREAESAHDDLLARRKAITIEVHRLQQLAERCKTLLWSRP